jgi:hypothetical protein
MAGGQRAAAVWCAIKYDEPGDDRALRHSVWASQHGALCVGCVATCALSCNVSLLSRRVSGYACVPICDRCWSTALTYSDVILMTRLNGKRDIYKACPGTAYDIICMDRASGTRDLHGT